jgi:uncharacterized protein (DUF1697 family)
VTTYVALLRGVNVGGKNLVPMARLRSALEKRGIEGVTTILQSGNVVLRSAKGEKAVAALLGDTIDDAFGLRVTVAVRSEAQLAGVASTNPFLEEGDSRDPSSLHVAFLTTRPAAAAIARLDPDRSPPDAFAVAGREVYLSYPAGSGRTRLTLDYLERMLGVEGTARNWRTVQRLAAAVS